MNLVFVTREVVFLCCIQKNKSKKMAVNFVLIKAGKSFSYDRPNRKCLKIELSCSKWLFYHSLKRKSHNYMIHQSPSKFSKGILCDVFIITKLCLDKNYKSTISKIIKVNLFSISLSPQNCYSIILRCGNNLNDSTSEIPPVLLHATFWV